MAHLLSEQKEHLLLHPETDLISLKDARVPAGAFAMRPLNELHVQQLVESDEKAWPEIVVTLCVAGYIVVDGYHRWAAAVIKQNQWIKATCRAYDSEVAVVEAAFRANLHHGLKASQQNRGDYAYWLHVSNPDMEQTEIASRVGLSQGAVSKAIASRDAAAKRAMQQQQNLPADPKEQQRVLKQSCRTFTRTALHFLQEVDTLSDEELMQLLMAIVQKREDKAKLVRIGRLFSGAQPAVSSTTGPLRLSQFVSPRVTGGLQDEA